MTFTEAAAEVLRQVGRPLHFKEITAYAIENSLLSHVGKSPEITMGARLAALFKKPDEDNPMVRVRQGFFALKSWEESGQLKEMVAKTKPTARTVTASELLPEADEDDAVETPTPTAKRSAKEDVKEEAPSEVARESDRIEPIRRRARVIHVQPSAPLPTPPDTAPFRGSHPFEPPVGFDNDTPGNQVPSDVRPHPERSVVVPPVRQELASDTESEVDADDEALDGEGQGDLATATSGEFDDEEDDLPILPNQESGADREGSRRRRRRRRRAKGPETNVATNTATNVPASATSSVAVYSAAPPLPAVVVHSEIPSVESRSSASTSVGPHPIVLEVGSKSLDHVAIDDMGGMDLADAIALLLAASDRGSGAVSLRQLAETAQRRGRMGGDLQQLQSQIAASVRADNVRRIAAGQRPRFRFVGGRVASTDWLLNNDLARLEQEAMAGVERYREAARKVFARKLQELPGPAFVELVQLVFERLGFRHFRAIRRTGIPAQETHYTAQHEAGAGQLQSVIAIRRDGREIGRERVTELRGSLHHYGPAFAGWLITGGSVLSGAREEAAMPNASPIILHDGFGIARLCEQHDIAVVRTTLPVCIPDLDILEALRSS